MATIKSQGSFSASVLSAQLPPKLVEATDGFIVSIVLPFPQCHRAGFFFGGVGPLFELRASHLQSRFKLYGLNHTSSPFCPGYVGDGVWQTASPGWPQITIFPISVSQVTRFTGIATSTQLRVGSFVLFCSRDGTQGHTHTSKHSTTEPCSEPQESL
jgi:hypothetical protein